MSSCTAVETVTTRIERADDSRTIPRLETRDSDLNAYARRGFQISSTIAIESGDHTIIVDTLTKPTE